MKILNIVFLVLGLLELVSGIIEIITRSGGTTFGYKLNHPFYGIYHIAIGSILLLAAYTYFKKKKRSD